MYFAAEPQQRFVSLPASELRPAPPICSDDANLVRIETLSDSDVVRLEALLGRNVSQRDGGMVVKDGETTSDDDEERDEERDEDS
jgi:hypothetical protein